MQELQNTPREERERKRSVDPVTSSTQLQKITDHLLCAVGLSTHAHPATVNQEKLTAPEAVNSVGGFIEEDTDRVWDTDALAGWLVLTFGKAADDAAEASPDSVPDACLRLSAAWRTVGVAAFSVKSVDSQSAAAPDGSVTGELSLPGAVEHTMDEVEKETATPRVSGNKEVAKLSQNERKQLTDDKDTGIRPRLLKETTYTQAEVDMALAKVLHRTCLTSGHGDLFIYYIYIHM